MKKIMLIIFLFLISLTVYATSNNQVININDINLKTNTIYNNIISELNTNNIKMDSTLDGTEIDFTNQVISILFSFNGEETRKELLKLIDNNSGVKNVQDTLNKIVDKEINIKEIKEINSFKLSDTILVTYKVSTNIKENDFIDFIISKKDSNYRLDYIIYDFDKNINEQIKNTRNEELDNKSYKINPPLTFSGIFNSYKGDLELNSIKLTYLINKTNIVSLKTMNRTNIIKKANGFFIAPGIIITTYNYLEKSLGKDNRILINDDQHNSYTFKGVIDVYKNLDIAVLRIEESNNTYVDLTINPEISTGESLITMSSIGGIYNSFTTGVLINKNNDFLISLQITDEQTEGSLSFNSSGKLVGFNTSLLLNNYFTASIPYKYINSLQVKYISKTLENIPYKTLRDLTTISNNYELTPESTYSELTPEQAKIMTIGNQKDNITYDLIKIGYYENTFSFRYKNNTSDSVLNNISGATMFIDNLLTEGYELTFGGEDKYILENHNYKIMIQSVFDYLNIIVERKV